MGELHGTMTVGATRIHCSSEAVRASTARKILRHVCLPIDLGRRSHARVSHQTLLLPGLTVLDGLDTAVPLAGKELFGVLSFPGSRSVCDVQTGRKAPLRQRNELWTISEEPTIS